NVGLMAAAFAGEQVEQLFALQLEALEKIPVDINEWGAGRDSGATAAWHLGSNAWAARYLALTARDAFSRAGSAGWSSVEESAAQMAALAGDLDRARSGFAAARKIYADSGRGPCVAICRYNEALALARNGRSGDAADLLHRAEADFHALDMPPWVARAKEL